MFKINMVGGVIIVVRTSKKAKYSIGYSSGVVIYIVKPELETRHQISNFLEIVFHELVHVEQFRRKSLWGFFRTRLDIEIRVYEELEAYLLTAKRILLNDKYMLEFIKIIDPRFNYLTEPFNDYYKYNLLAPTSSVQNSLEHIECATGYEINMLDLLTSFEVTLDALILNPNLDIYPEIEFMLEVGI